MLLDPKVKPRLWNLKTGTLVHNCTQMGLPVPVLAMPMWAGTGDKVFDYSGNQYHGSFVGPVWSPEGVEFDGINDYIDLSSVWPSTTYNDFALSFWYKSKITTPVDDQYIFVDDISVEFMCCVSDDVGHIGEIRGYLGPGETTRYSGISILDKKWHHIIWTRTGSTIRFYTDGIKTTVSDVTQTPTTATGHTYIGDDPGATEQVDGYIAQLQLFLHGLSETQSRRLRIDPYGMFEPIKDYRIWSFITEGETFYKTIAGNQPASTGSVTTIGTYKQIVAGNVPNPVAVIVKGIKKDIVGNVPSPIAVVTKKTSIQVVGSVPSPAAVIVKKTEKELIGEQLAPSGDVIYKSIYKQSVAGDIPNPVGNLSSVLAAILALTGSMPATIGNIVKRINKILFGSKPAPVGDITKQTKKNVVGEQPAPTGKVSHATKTFLFGVMGNITGIVSTILNPVAPASLKLCRLVGSCFKKLIG